jgi:hypothetical protein
MNNKRRQSNDCLLLLYQNNYKPFRKLGVKAACTFVLTQKYQKVKTSTEMALEAGRRFP